MTTPMSFDELLDIDASDAIKPPTRPGGTYICTVALAEQVKSSKKGNVEKRFAIQLGWC